MVVSGSQGIGMLNNLMCEHVKNGERVLPLDISVHPGEDLKLNEALPQALHTSRRFAQILSVKCQFFAGKGE